MGTYSVRASEITQDWYVVDAEGQILGRLASEIASVLKGKRKPTYSTHLDVGDNVIVVNAEKVLVTGRKRDNKIYFRHSLYPGGLSEKAAEKLSPVKVTNAAAGGVIICVVPGWATKPPVARSSAVAAPVVGGAGSSGIVNGGTLPAWAGPARCSTRERDRGPARRSAPGR